jgi:hypothetical protein
LRRFIDGFAAYAPQEWNAPKKKPARKTAARKPRTAAATPAESETVADTTQGA